MAVKEAEDDEDASEESGEIENKVRALIKLA